MKRFWSNIIEQKASTSWYKRTLTAFSENSTNLLGHLFDKFVRTPELQFAENIGLSYDQDSDSLVMKLNSGTYDLNEKFDGKVDGPASSVENSIPVFDGVTGKLLKGQFAFTIEGSELKGGLDGSIKLNNSTLTNSALSIQTGSYNEEDAIKIGRNSASQHYISFKNSTAGGSANLISFKVWNNSSQRNTILRLQSPFNSSVGEAIITGKLQVNSGNIILPSGQMGLGTENPIAGTRLDISDGSLSLNIGADSDLTTRTNATAKTGRITSMHYTNAEEPQLLIQGFSDATTNIVNIGGGTSLANTATATVIYAAANNTTLTGTEVARFNTTGLGIGTNNPSQKLHVIGNTLASGDSASATKTIGGKVRMEYDTATDTLEFNFI